MCDMPSGPYKPSAKELKRRQESDDEDHHRAVMRAEEIRADPSRMAGVLRHHRKQQKAVARMNRSLGGSRASR
jgi:hypothetical protein